MSFGGSLDCGSLERDNEPWSLVAKRARGRFDMRPIKVAPRFAKRGCQHGNACRDSACRIEGNVCSIERDNGEANICGIDQFHGSWERVPVTVDSGAYDSVMPFEMAQGVPIKQTEASKRGLSYRAANGTRVRNQGERNLKGYTSEGNAVDMSMQVCDVTKPLGSVRAMMRAGNRVILDSDDSYICNKETGVITNIKDIY